MCVRYVRGEFEMRSFQFFAGSSSLRCRFDGARCQVFAASLKVFAAGSKARGVKSSLLLSNYGLGVSFQGQGGAADL
jgi:hypothetical protein